nr:MAG TPA: hypothetical protein [Caudoviricetes sp.]
MKLLWLINERYRYYVLKRSILTITNDLIIHKIDFLLDLVDNKKPLDHVETIQMFMDTIESIELSDDGYSFDYTMNKYDKFIISIGVLFAILKYAKLYDTYKDKILDYYADRMNEYGYIFEDDFPSTMREIYIIFQKLVKSNMNSELIHRRFRNLSEDIQRNKV